MPLRRLRTFWSRSVAAGATLAAAAALPQAAHAYVGPGAGLTALGTVIALVLALGLAIIGFLWYPMKRLARKRNSRSGVEGSENKHERE